MLSRQSSLLECAGDIPACGRLRVCPARHARTHSRFGLAGLLVSLVPLGI